MKIMKRSERKREREMKEKDIRLENTLLLKEIEVLLSKLDMTPLIKDRLRLALIRYEYCRLNKLSSYNYSLEEINDEEFNNHLVGFIDGDGYIKTGKRTGHKKGLYRLVPNITIELSIKDDLYLNLIISKIFSGKKKLHYRTDNSIVMLYISSKEELNIVMKLIDENNGLLSEKKSKEYIKLKKLLSYLDKTKQEIHGEAWLEKGMKYWLNKEKLLGRETREEELDLINNNLTLDYVLGYIEAEGSLNLHDERIKGRIYSSFEITQNKENDLI